MDQIVIEMQTELETHILPFWMRLIDKKYGGFYGRVDRDLKIIENSPKGSILNSRILWAFSSAFNVLKNNDYLSYAHHAYEFMMEKLLDTSFGGLYLLVDNKGNPLDTRKHVNPMCYAIYALSEYYLTTRQPEVKKFALSLFDLIEDKKGKNGIYLEEFDEKWNKKSNDLLDRFDLMAEITLNTQLHLLEAYTLLYEICGDEKVLNQISIIIKFFEDYMFSSELSSFNEFFNSEWVSLINLKSFGHDIEASWLLSKALDVTRIKNSTIINIIEKICNNVKTEAMENDSVILESLNGKTNKNRMWWVQTEAVIGFINAYQIFGYENFLEDAKRIWNFIKTYLIDKRPNGEWYSGVSENFQYFRDEDIVNPWKGPYHNTRM